MLDFKSIMRGTSLVVALGLGVAATSCSSSSDASAPVSNDVEIFSWWIHPGEIDALNALLGVVRTQQPSLNIINSAANVNYGDTQQLLNDRMVHGEPPDTFQVHGGAELISQWVSVNGDDTQNRMESIDFLYDQEGWRSVFPPKLVDVLSYKGHVYSVPINIHRGNVLFYNVSVFGDAKLTPPTTWDEFFVVADKLKAAGKVPLALGGKDNFALGMIFDAGLLAKGGADYYTAFFQGTKDPNNDKEVADTVAMMVKIMGYVQPDPGNGGWDKAADMVHNGTAAMTIMGDWAKGYLVQQGMKPDTDFGAVPAPDTAGSFIFITDTFGLPKGAPHRSNAVAMLEALGTVQVEDAFNPIKGSIPARLDTDHSKYDTMANRTMDDYQQATNSTDPKKGLVPSCAHGSAASQAFLSDLNAALAGFLTSHDGTALLQAIVNDYPRLKNQ